MNFAILCFIVDDSKILLMINSFAFALTFSLLITPLIIRISHKMKWFDSPDERKIHSGEIPRIGGIGIVAALLISGFVAPLIGTFILGQWVSPLKKLTPNIFLALGGLIIFATGLWDDFKNMPAKIKLLLQIIAAVFACIGGAMIHRIMIPFIWVNLEMGIFAWPITVFWLVAIMNAMNLIDGMDGLAGMIGVIAALIYGVVFLLDDKFMLAILSFTMGGAISGFMFFNFPPAQIFMGDSGALFLGYFLGTIPLAASPQSGGSLILPLTMMIIPIGDVIATLIRRKRDGIAFFEPDREHMHHKLLNMGKDERWILNLVCIFSFGFGVCTIGQHFLPARQGMFLIIIDWIIAVIFFTLLHFLNKFHKMKRKNQ
jgi:UDP-GlcNAc:undecaprenyl-phosphate GlcNAc-1-phosphate transferase